MTDLLVPRWCRLAMLSVRSALTVAALTLLMGFAAVGVFSAPGPSSPSTRLGMSSGPLDELIRDNRCSLTGFDRGVHPRSALVRTPEGETVLVGFDRGWAVFSGEVAGELLAVCLGPVEDAVR